MSTPYITSIERHNREQWRLHEQQLLVRQARLKFGDAVAETLAVLLESVDDVDALADIGAWIIECPSGDAFLSRVQEQAKRR